MSRESNIVIISELEAPDNFKCIWSQKLIEHKTILKVIVELRNYLLLIIYSYYSARANISFITFTNFCVVVIFLQLSVNSTSLVLNTTNINQLRNPDLKYLHSSSVLYIL